MLESLKTYIESIPRPNEVVAKEMEVYIDGLTKPVGSLGKLEKMVIQLASLQGTMAVKTKPRATIIMCADNGVCNQGVSSCPQEVTATVTYNFTRGITAMNCLSAFADATMHVVDIGVREQVVHPSIRERRVMAGTRDMTLQPAMTKEEVLQAIWVGIEEAELLMAQGYQIFGTGEMGIGNTTTSAAVAAVLLEQEVSVVTGKGAGAGNQVYKNKIEAIEKAIRMHQPKVDDPLDVLAKVGGLDLAGLVGVYLAAAKQRKLVVIDGFIAASAALVAYSLCNKTKHVMIASHLSKEVGMQKILEKLGLEAHFDLEMRLGEGSGCPILFQMLDMATYTLLGMGTFEEAGVDKTDYENVWKKK